MPNKLKPLIIGDLKINIPIFQGGMGVKVSTAPLVSAVANCGGAGTIASVGLFDGLNKKTAKFVQESSDSLRKEIRKTKKLTNGVFGVNIMVALSNYEELVKVSVQEEADFIVSGAGLPLRLPKLVEGSNIKLIIIVSSGRAADLIIKTWKTKYNRLTDAIVVEGPLAGGHLGFKPEELSPSKTQNRLAELVTETLEVTKKYQEKYGINIPVIAAGGVFDGKDIAKFIKLGASGVQIATRFVATDECEVSQKFKERYVSAKEEDVIIVSSPVGLPGRAIKNKFTDDVAKGKTVPTDGCFRCIRSCNPAKVPYCIATALTHAFEGNLDEALIFAGSNVGRIKEIVPVKQLMDELIEETNLELSKK